MELQKGIYFILHFFGITFINCETKIASIGLLDDAPKYGTYPHKSSNDQYMDPCKACKIYFSFSYMFFSSNFISI
jgi:hypothetical protein